MIYHGHRPETWGTLDDLPTEVAVVVEILTPHLDRFDGIAVTGLSGILPGVPASLTLGKRLLVLRKDGDNSHRANYHPGAEGVKRGTRWLILDDFIAQGATVERVRKFVEGWGATPVGLLLTRPNHGNSAAELTWYTEEDA